MIIDIMGKKYDYKAYKDDMYMYLMKLRLMNNKSFRRVFKIDLTNKFINSMRKIVDPNHLFENNTIWSMSGATGSGKSLCVMSLIKVIEPDRFNYKHFCFFDEEILTLAKKIDRDSFIVRDEGTNKAIFGIGSNRQSANLQLVAEASRKRGLSLCFIEPEEKPSDIVKWYMETVDMDINNRITRIALKEPRNMEYIGAVYVPVLPDNDRDWVNYNKVKDKFIKDINEGNLSGAKVDVRSLAKEIFTEIDTSIYKSKKERKAYVLTKYPHFTNSEIDLILTYLEIYLREGSIDKEIPGDPGYQVVNNEKKYNKEMEEIDKEYSRDAKDLYLKNG